MGDMYLKRLSEQMAFDEEAGVGWIRRDSESIVDAPGSGMAVDADGGVYDLEAMECESSEASAEAWAEGYEEGYADGESGAENALDEDDDFCDGDD